MVLNSTLDRRLVVVITLPLTGSDVGFGGVRVGVTSMPSDMSGGCRMTCSSGSETSGGVSGIASSGVSSEGRDTHLGHRQLAKRPSAPRLDGFTRPVVMWMPDFKVHEHSFGGVGSSHCQRDVRLLLESLGWNLGHGARTPYRLSLR